MVTAIYHLKEYKLISLSSTVENVFDVSSKFVHWTSFCYFPIFLIIFPNTYGNGEEGQGRGWSVMGASHEVRGERVGGVWGDTGQC